jgi:hypothetical protein
MRNRLCFVLLAAGALTGCPTTTVDVDSGDGQIHLVDGNVPMGDTGDHDGGRDTGPAGACGSTGTVGGHCRSAGSAQCVASATCFAGGAVMTINDAFGIPPGSPMNDPAHMDYQLIDTSATPETADFNGLAGSICAQQCNTAAATDMCGTCTSCSTAMTQMPLIQAFGGIVTVIPTTSRMFGADTGICRVDCTYDRTTRGAECPDQMTCDEFGGVCVESCTSNNECNMAYGVTYEGELVTLVNHDHPEVCNMTTGRCEFPADQASTTANVGDHCDSNADCRGGTGICLNGGHCAEFGCTSPGTPTSVCGGPMNNLGICLTVNGTAHSTNLCLTGCNSALDCGAGNICNILMDGTGAVFTIAGGGRSYTGYCIGGCQTDDQCNANEACTDYNTIDAMTGMVVPNGGRCVPRCGGTASGAIAVGAVGTSTGTTASPGNCLPTEWCSPDASNTNGHTCASATDCAAPYGMCLFGVCRSSAPTFGFCAPLGAFCGDANTNHLQPHTGDCAATQICDETLATPRDPMTHAVQREQFGDGHCVAPCTATTDCVAAHYPTGALCVTSGAYTGLCRLPCTGTATTTVDGGLDAGADASTVSTECPSGQTCDTAEHFCVEVMAPAM